MKSILVLLYILILSGPFYSCKNHNHTAYNYSDKTTEAKPIPEEDSSEIVVSSGACITTDKDSTTGTSKHKKIINQSGYNYSYTDKTDFQGAMGYGTGGSYASNYYGSAKKGQNKKVCTQNDQKEIVQPSLEQPQSGFTTPEKEAQKFDSYVEDQTWSDWNSPNDSTQTVDTRTNQWDEAQMQSQYQDSSGSAQPVQENDISELPW